MQLYFCKGNAAGDYQDKADLGKGYWNPKRKMWVKPPIFQRQLNNHNSKKSV